MVYVDMPTPERCLARAEEAERLASMVSYARDRERLIRQAAEWRARAEDLARTRAGPSPAPARDPPLRRLLRRLRRATS